MRKRFKLLGAITLVGLLLTGCTTGNSEKTVQEKVEPNDELILYVVRHGKTMLNTTDRVQGWSDAVLTKSGEEVVSAAGKGMKDIDFQSAYSSDSGRAIQTANLIIEENKKASKLQVETDPRLREFNFGMYEGDLNHTMWGDIAEKNGITIEEFMKNMTPQYFADNVAELDKEKNKEGNNWPAEDYETVTKRLTESIDDIVKKENIKDGSGNVLIVSHGLSISSLLDTLFEEFEMPEGGLKNASVATIKVKDGKYELMTSNDVSFIEEGQN